MEYTTDELLALIERHDQFEDYYREKLVDGIKAEALEEFAATIEPPLGVPTELRRERYVRQEVRTEALHAAAALRGER